MFQASQDGGDSTSITSGFENEYKKISTGILKSTRNSLKKRVHSLGHESDDAVIEPLLQKDKDKDKVDIVNQSAKYLLSKTKTEHRELKSNDVGSKVSQPLITSGSNDKPDSTVANSVKETLPKCTATNGHTGISSSVNYSNGSIGCSPSPKTQILVDIEGHKTTGHGPSPLIFTTAKIHVDGKTKEMEPVHVTVGPILSTVEASKTSSVVNNEPALNTPVSQENDRKKGSVVKAVTNDIKLYSQASKTPDIVASTAKQPSVHKVSTFSTNSGADGGVTNAATNTNVSFSNQTQSTTTAGVSNITTREKLEKLEAYWSKSEGRQNDAIKSPVTAKGTKTLETEVSGKATKDKDIARVPQELSSTSKASKDTTIKIEPLVIGKNLDGLDNIGMKQNKQADKVNGPALAMGGVDKKTVGKIDAQASKDASKIIEKATPTCCDSDDKRTLKDTSSSGSSSKDINKVGSIKQLHRQKKSATDEANAIDSKVKPNTSSALPTPASVSTSKTLPAVELTAKKEVNEKVGKAVKTSSITAKDIKDNSKVQKAGDVSSIPIKTTKVMNVAATPKSAATAKSSTASTIKQPSSNVASATSTSSQPTSSEKSANKSTSSSMASSTVAPKSSVKTVQQNSKDGKPSKA